MPLGHSGIRHILTQIGIVDRVPDELIPAIAEHILVPQPPFVHFANQRRTLGSIELMLVTISAMRLTRGMPMTTGSMLL